MASQSELRLVARILAGESGAIDEFISNYRPFVYAIWIRHLKLQPQDADDLFQQFLIHIWQDDFRRLREWRERSALHAYLGKVARNLAHDFKRRERRKVPAEVLDRPVVDRRFEFVDTADALEGAMAKLSKRDRDLLHRRYFLDESYREIAKALGITVNNVGVALLRAEQRLKRIILGAM